MFEEVLSIDRQITLLLALTLTAIGGLLTGPVKDQAQPLLWQAFEVLFGPASERLNRPNRAEADLLFRGLMLMIFAVAFAAFLALLGVYVMERVPSFRVLDMLFLAVALGGGALWRLFFQLHQALQKSGRPSKKGSGIYYVLARSARQDLSQSDDHAILRAAFSMGARHFDRAVIGTGFWYLLAGLLGAYIYAVLALLVERNKVGYGRRREAFGRGFAVLFAVIHIIPNIISGLLLSIAALFVPAAGMTRTLINLAPGEGKSPLLLGGASETAIAWALQVSLGGPETALYGHTVKRAWVGPKDATAKVEIGHLKKALMLLVIAYVLTMVLIVGGIVWLS